MELTKIENPETVEKITAHYSTPSRMIERTREFTNVKTFQRWEKYAEGKFYNISCIDIDRKVSPMNMPEGTKFEDLPPAREGYKWVRNARFGGYTQEAEGTPFACSVSSESYWCS